MAGGVLLDVRDFRSDKANFDIRPAELPQLGRHHHRDDAGVHPAIRCLRVLRESGQFLFHEDRVRHAGRAVPDIHLNLIGEAGFEIGGLVGKTWRLFRTTRPKICRFRSKK